VVLLQGAVRLKVQIPHGKRTWQRHSALGGKHSGRYIRHASGWVAPPIRALAVAMVLAPFLALLVTAVSQTVLLPARLLPTVLAAVVLSPVTVATDPEDLATPAGTTNSLTEDNFGVGRHLRPEVGLDNGDRSWQLEHLLMFGYLMKVCHTGNSTAITAGFPLPTGGDQTTR
jgi:hypothetical protein